MGTFWFFALARKTRMSPIVWSGAPPGQSIANRVFSVAKLDPGLRIDRYI